LSTDVQPAQTNGVER